MIALVVTPLLSQAANRHRPGRHTQGEPAREGRQEVLESARPVSYGTLRAASPTTTPLIPYKSEVLAEQTIGVLVATPLPG